MKCAQLAALTLLTYSYIAVGEVSSTDTQPCGPYIKYPNGSNTLHTIGAYLENSTRPPCPNRVNSALRDMFKNGSTGTILRSSMGNLGNVCAIFTQVISILKSNDLGPKICEENSFSNEKITGRDFCSIQLESPAISSMQSTLNSIGYGSYSQELAKLLSLGDQCIVKCGRGSGLVLCNAFYSVMQLFSKVIPPIVESIPSQASGKHCLVAVTVCPLCNIRVLSSGGGGGGGGKLLPQNVQLPPQNLLQ